MTDLLRFEKRLESLDEFDAQPLYVLAHKTPWWKSVISLTIIGLALGIALGIALISI